MKWEPQRSRRDDPPWGWILTLRGGDTITVHTRHGLNGFYVSAHRLGLVDKALASATPEGAQLEALAVIRAHLARLLDEVREASGGAP